MARIAAFLNGVTRSACATGDLGRTEMGTDTAEFEIGLLRQALRPARPVLLRLAQIGQL